MEMWLEFKVHLSNQVNYCDSLISNLVSTKLAATALADTSVLCLKNRE